MSNRIDLSSTEFSSARAWSAPSPTRSQLSRTSSRSTSTGTSSSVQFLTHWPPCLHLRMCECRCQCTLPLLTPSYALVAIRGVAIALHKDAWQQLPFGETSRFFYLNYYLTAACQSRPKLVFPNPPIPSPSPLCFYPADAFSCSKLSMNALSGPVPAAFGRPSLNSL